MVVKPTLDELLCTWKTLTFGRCNIILVLKTTLGIQDILNSATNEEDYFLTNVKRFNNCKKQH